MVASKEPLLHTPLGQEQPFRPLGSARKPEGPTVIDDRRRFVENLPGETYANEVLVNPSGAWPNVFVQPPAPLVECIRLTLPRPEPLIVSIHPWQNTNDRFRRAARLAAEIQVEGVVIPDPITEQGRVIIEWGSGKARNYTWVDAAPGSLQIPLASQVRISAWTFNAPIRLACTVQVGYATGPLNCTWTGFAASAALDSIPFGFNFPHYAREFTGFMQGFSLNDRVDVSLIDEVLFPRNIMQMRPPITPNPTDRPKDLTSVPIPGPIIGMSVTTHNSLLLPNGVSGGVTVTVRI